MKWKLVDSQNCELEGPYECPNCHGHFMLDITFLDQINTITFCPYCRTEGGVDETI